MHYLQYNSHITDYNIVDFIWERNLSLKVAKNKVGENWRNNHQFVKGYSDCMFVFVFVNKCIIIYIAHEQNVLFIQ